MITKKGFTYLQAVVMAACITLAGCGGEEWTYQTDRELKPGPGLFSGEDGEFNIIGKPKKHEEDQEKEPEQEKE